MNSFSQLGAREEERGAAEVDLNECTSLLLIAGAGEEEEEFPDPPSSRGCLVARVLKCLPCSPARSSPLSPGVEWSRELALSFCFLRRLRPAAVVLLSQ